MSKLPGLFTFIFLIGFYSCSSPTDDSNTNSDSVIVDSSKVDSVKVDSVQIDTATGIKDIETLLPQLPLLKFPLTFTVDSFANKKNIRIAFDENSPWFTNSLNFSRGKNVVAAGKFYIDFNTTAVIFVVSSPSDFSERPDDRQLVLSLFNIKTGITDSRSIAIGDADVSGNTIMKTPDKGKGYVHYESEDINITTQEFEIKDGAFVVSKSDDKIFKGDQKGSDAADLYIANWMK